MIAVPHYTRDLKIKELSRRNKLRGARLLCDSHILLLAPPLLVDRAEKVVSFLACASCLVNLNQGEIMASHTVPNRAPLPGPLTASLPTTALGNLRSWPHFKMGQRKPRPPLLF